MRLYITILLSILCIQAFSQELPKTDLFSPLSNISLDLENGKYELSKLIFEGHLILGEPYDSGTYKLNHDTLQLFSINGNTFKLLQESDEVYNPINLDSAKTGQKFLAWSIYYDNGQLKQNGGWSDKHQKQGVWQYYDSTGTVVNRRLFKNGKLKKDNFEIK